MQLPTLLRPGFLVPSKSTTKAEAEKLKTIIPIDYIINFISDRIPLKRGAKPKILPKSIGDKVIILKSNTGSGKSTVLPPYLYTKLFERTRKNIAVCVPTILVTIDITLGIPIHSPELKLDVNLGYNTGNFKRLPKEKGLIFNTTGIITQQLRSIKSENFIKKYQFIMIDEIHTRSSEMDLCIMMMKQLLEEYWDDPECPFLILASATFDEKLFIDYFKVPESNFIQVHGSTFEKHEIFPPYDVVDWEKHAVQCAKLIHLTNLGDITTLYNNTLKIKSKYKSEDESEDKSEDKSKNELENEFEDELENEFEDELEDKFEDESGNELIKHHVNKEPSQFRDIVIFVPTQAVGKKMVDNLLLFNCEILSKNIEEVNKYCQILEKEIEMGWQSKSKQNEVKGGNVSSDHSHYYILPILLSKLTYEAGGLEYQNLFSPLNTISVPIWKLKPGQSLDITAKPDKFVIPSRRVIITTNIMEVGITIDTLRYCIDTGFQFNVEFNPDFGAPLLSLKNITHGAAIQRKGRVGRLDDGYWHPCYSKSTYETLPNDQLSKVILDDCTDNLLSIFIKQSETEILEEESVAIIKSEDKRKTMELFQMNYLTNNSWWKLRNNKQVQISELDFLELPSASSLKYAIEKLHVLGMINDNYDITLFGYMANNIQFISIELKRMILSGFVHQACIFDLITIAAFVYTKKHIILDKKFKMPNVFEKMTNHPEYYNNILIADEFIMCIFLWNKYDEWLNSHINKQFNKQPNQWKTRDIIQIANLKKWCLDNGIIYSGWIIMLRNRDQLIENLISIGINVYYNGLELPFIKYNLLHIMKNNLEEGLDEIQKIKKCIYDGFRLNLCEFQKRSYIMLSKSIPIKIKSSILLYLNDQVAKQTSPKHIIISGYTIKKSMNNSVFEFLCDEFISVLDNFVEVDNRFILN